MTWSHRAIHPSMHHASPPCLLAAWSAHAAELRGYLRHQLDDPDTADDLLHEIVLRVLRQGGRFCAVEQPRAWLFQVARNAVTDHRRGRREFLPLSEELPAPAPGERAPVEQLGQCLPRVLAELSEEDRLALTLCDIEGLTQQALAERLGISLPGAKSRVQRARTRLQRRLVDVCQVRFDETGRVCCFTPRGTKSQ